MLIDLVLASDTASEDEVQRCVAAARPEVTVTAAPVPAAVPASAQVEAQRPVPAELTEFLGEEPSAAALRGPLRYIAATEGVSPPDTPEGSRDEVPNFDDRPPTPSPEGAAEMDVAKPPQPPQPPPPAPRPVPVEVLPVPTVSPMEPVEPLAAVAAPELTSTGCQLSDAPCSKL